MNPRDLPETVLSVRRSCLNMTVKKNIAMIGGVKTYA
jgi:hypothetical protein